MILLLVTACSCTSIPESQRVSGTFACRQTGDVLMFRPDGHLYYTFGGGSQPFGARYWYDDAGRMQITVMVSTHAGYLKEVRLAEGRDRLYVKYANFAQHGPGEFIFESIGR